MPEEKLARSDLIRDRNFLTDRLSEISLELARGIAEADELKQEMEFRAPDPPRLAAIRRRRVYLRRRGDDLKVERERAISERDRLVNELALTASADLSEESAP